MSCRLKQWIIAANNSEDRSSVFDNVFYAPGGLPSVNTSIPEYFHPWILPYFHPWILPSLKTSCRIDVYFWLDCCLKILILDKWSFHWKVILIDRDREMQCWTQHGIFTVVMHSHNWIAQNDKLIYILFFVKFWAKQITIKILNVTISWHICGNGYIGAYFSSSVSR